MSARLHPTPGARSSCVPSRSVAFRRSSVASSVTASTKSRVRHAVKDRLGADCALAPLPIRPQLEVVSRKRRGQELEHSQRDAPGVHLLEDLTDGLLRRVPPKFDHRYLVLLEPLDDLLLKIVPQLDLAAVVLPEPLEVHPPRARVECPGEREESRLVLFGGVE